MRHENLMLSIIADIYMERLNSAIEKVYGVNPIHRNITK